MNTLIIIPTYNERENLCPLLQEIFSYIPETDVLIVDDNSPDGTGKLADEMHNENPQVMDRRLGKSKMSRKIMVEAFTYVLRTRFSRHVPPALSRSAHGSANVEDVQIEKLPLC